MHATCSSSDSSNDFYTTVKPFLSDKNFYGGNKIILSEEKNIVSGPSQVADIFSMYYFIISEYKDDNQGEAVAKHACHKSIEMMNTTDAFPLKLPAKNIFKKT